MSSSQPRPTRVTSEERAKALRSALTKDVVRVKGLTSGQRRALQGAKDRKAS